MTIRLPRSADIVASARRLKRRVFGRRSSTMFHEGSRKLQGLFGSRALADRLVQELSRSRFNDTDKEFIEGVPFFFLATADGQGRPDCNLRGGLPGFARVTAPDELIFPDYDGNGMFKSLGNISVNPHVGILFLRIGDKPGRLRVNGRAEILFGDPRMAEIPGAQLLIRVTPTDIFSNCPRYIPHLKLVENAVDAPREGLEPIEPVWKRSDVFQDVLVARRR